MKSSFPKHNKGNSKTLCFPCQVQRSCFGEEFFIHKYIPYNNSYIYAMRISDNCLITVHI